MTPRPEVIKMLTVCGVGLGSSLVLRMTAQSVAARMGLRAEVEGAELSSAYADDVHVIIGASEDVEHFLGLVPLLVSVDDIADDVTLEARLRQALSAVGW